MTSNNTVRNGTPGYALGYTNAEQERLIRQAARIAPITERMFQEAGIGPGQKILDLGSGMGDVALLAARRVGPTGEVVGIERDAASIARARERVAAAGLHNVTFTQSDVKEISGDRPFDAAVGRFILMFLPDPEAVLRSVFRLVRPGGVLAFQEPTWVPILAFGKDLPLWSETLAAIHQTFVRAGVNPEMGPALNHLYQKIGLPAPAMRAEMLIGSDTELMRLISDLLGSIRPLAEQHAVSYEPLGDLDTLPQRIHSEMNANHGVISFIPIVSVWSRKAA